MVERFVRIEEVEGSIPSRSTKFRESENSEYRRIRVSEYQRIGVSEDQNQREVISHLRALAIVIPRLTKEAREIADQYKILSKRLNTLHKKWH